MKEVSGTIEERVFWVCPECDSYNEHRVCTDTMCDVCGEEFKIKYNDEEGDDLYA